MKHTLAEPTIERRDALLRAAATVFAREGIAETSLRQIAREAGISSGTLHYYFPRKDELLDALILKVVTPLHDQAWHIIQANAHPRAQLERLIGQMFQLFDSSWDLYYVALMLGDYLRARRPKDFPSMTGVLAELVRRGQDKGLIRAGDPLLWAILCHGIILRVQRARAFAELEPPLAQHTEQVVEACWRVLSPDPAKPNHCNELP